MTRAAAIIIGDEILSGKVQDVNTPLLVASLRDLGVELWRVSFIGDELQDIAHEVRFCADRCDVVITSGGIGPTHDDRTLAGVALAFGVPLQRQPEIELLIRKHLRDRLTETALAMADAPQGSRLLYADDGLFPLVVFRNVYLLPGVPELFAAKLETLGRQLSGFRKALCNIYLRCDESLIAEDLTRVAELNPAVKIGSYPSFSAADHRLWVTIEGRDTAAVSRAAQQLLDLLPSEHVVRVENNPAE